ncbi:MAG: NAD-dependent epimerase/dehydratase family protein [Proteobacteria bacterium]|nr:NAD-dependent epimerase/dehydratase family protein [Pseudomonadota bacterium]
MKKRAVLVTGATGFIGKYVMACLIKEGLRVFALTRADDGGFAFNSDVEIVNGDITNRLVIPDEVSTIYHCAGVIGREDDIWPVNVQGTQNVVEVAFDHNCRLIYLSSAGVVGRTTKKTVDEETPCNPDNLYEMTKFKAEEIVRQGIKRGLKAQMLRPTTVFGEGREPEKDSFLQLMRSIAAGRYRHIRKGRGIYNIIYAGEVAHAMFVLDNDNIPNGRTYFINTPVSFSEFTSIVSKSLGNQKESIGNLPYIVAFTAAGVFSFIGLLTGKKRGLTFSRLKALTDTRVFSQERLLNETDYRPFYRVDEYLEQLCNKYRKIGFLS